MWKGESGKIVCYRVKQGWMCVSVGECVYDVEVWMGVSVAESVSVAEIVLCWSVWLFRVESQFQFPPDACLNPVEVF